MVDQTCLSDDKSYFFSYLIMISSQRGHTPSKGKYVPLNRLGDGVNICLYNDKKNVNACQASSCQVASFDKNLFTSLFITSEPTVFKY